MTGPIRVEVALTLGEACPGESARWSRALRRQESRRAGHVLAPARREEASN
jgi:hypothetical protein